MTLQATFEAQLAFGRSAEDLVEAWLLARGWLIVPTRDGARDGRGARLLLPSGEKVVLPDFLLMRDGEWRWLDAKRKRSWSLYRRTGQLTTGIDLGDYLDYQRAAALTGIPAWLAFLHDHADDRGPRGLFGGALDRLRRCESHRTDAFGKGGMVFWWHDDLDLLATLEELNAAAEPELPTLESLFEQPSDFLRSGALQPILN